MTKHPLLSTKSFPCNYYNSSIHEILKITRRATDYSFRSYHHGILISFPQSRENTTPPLRKYNLNPPPISPFLITTLIDHHCSPILSFTSTLYFLLSGSPIDSSCSPMKHDLRETRSSSVLRSSISIFVSSVTSIRESGNESHEDEPLKI